MTRNPTTPFADPPSPRRHGWRVRFIVLGPLAVAAALITALGAEVEVCAPLLLPAIAWTVLASLDGALMRGFRLGNWSGFIGHRFPRDGGEFDEWASRTGCYARLGDPEDRLRDDDHLR